MVYHRGDRVEVSVDVTNTGDRYGKEVVQLYIMPQIETDAILRLELRGFEKVGLKSGETKTVHFTLDRRAFSSYNIQRQKWMAERGDYIIACGDSSENLPMQQTVHIEGDLPIPKCITMDTTFGDVLRIPGAANLVTPFAAVFGATNESADENAMGESTAEMMEAIEAWAADEFRSTNGQIQYILDQALRKAGRLKKKRKMKSEENDKE